MAPRWQRILLLTFQAVWLGVVVPGHTRGVVTLPGTASADSSAPCTERACCRKDSPDAGKHQDQERQKRACRCAICFFVARLSTPPPVDFCPPPSELTERCPPEPAISLASLPVQLAYLATGPPCLAAV